MKTEKIERLIAKYFEGETSLEEEEILRNYFQSGHIADRLKSYRDQFAYSSELGKKEPRKEFDPLEKIDYEESAGTSDGKDNSAAMGSQISSKVLWTLRIAAGLILLLVGFSAGLLVTQQEQASGEQVAALQEEIQQMKTALVYGYDRQLTASERISAVRLSNRFPEQPGKLDSEITDILIYTLNNDDNVNVREAAAEALFRFHNEPKIRKALVNALSRQTNPLMQITLINMLVELKETSAINEMQKLLMDSETRDLVKTRLEVGIAELKT